MISVARYGAVMAKRVSHPFTIHIRKGSSLRGGFGWLVRQDRYIVEESPAEYDTFEDARLAGKSVLDEMIAVWMYGAASNKSSKGIA